LYTGQPCSSEPWIVRGISCKGARLPQLWEGACPDPPYWVQLKKYRCFHKEPIVPTTYNFQWQNPILLKDIYPMRLQKLRDFLIFYKEADLWAQYRNTNISALAADVKEYEAGMAAARADELKQYSDLKKFFMTKDVRGLYARYMPFEEEAVRLIQQNHDV